jgi:hypothetical protein
VNSRRECRISKGDWPDNQPSLAVNPEQADTIVLTAYAHRPDGRRISLYRSTDGGASFEEELLPLPTGFTHSGAATVAAGSPGVFLVAGDTYNDPATDGSIVVYSSTDNGQSFGTPVIARHGSGTESFFDKPTLAIDHSPDSPYCGRAYLAYTGFVNRMQDSEIYIQSSSDHGATWTKPLRVSPIGTRVHGATLAVGPEGELYVGWIHHGPGRARLNLRRSDDGGKSFGRVITVATVRVIPSPLLNTDWNFRVPTFARLAVDTSSGRYRGTLHAVWQHERCGRSTIFLSSSADGGLEWSYPVKVNPIRAEAHDFFPAVTVSPETGAIHVVYYSNRVSPSKLDVFAALSTNGGFSFGPSRRLTGASFDPDADPSFGRPCLFLGDYIGAASLPGNRVMAAWTDTRPGAQAIFAATE